MEYYLQKRLNEDKKFNRYLKENTQYIKQLNRNPLYYKEFIKDMKIIYKERTSDKLNDALNTIDIISSIISTLN